MVTRYTVRATHQGEFGGIPPTGKQIEMKGIWIHRLAGGKIVEGRQWGLADVLGVYRQLGRRSHHQRRESDR